MTAPARIVQGATPAVVAELAARHVADACRAAIAARGECRLALAGGSTPRATYERLAALPPGALDWSRVHVFFGDERAVPPDDPASNYRMANEALLSRVPIPPANVHRIAGELPPPVAAEKYAEELVGPPLDLALLGMGDDGHVASLFPGGPELSSSGRLVVPSRAPVAPHDRVTLTLDALARAREVAMLVTGAPKAPRLRQVLAERASGAAELPAARVAPHSGALLWFLDDAAAAALDSR